MKATKAAVAAIIGAMVLTACSSGGSTTESNGKRDDGLTPITIGVAPVISAAAVHLGEEKGVFRKHGLDVTFKELQNGSAILTQLHNGQIQFGLSAIVPVVTAASNGVPVKAVTAADFVPTDTEHGIGGLLVKADGAIAKPEDMAGKTVGVGALKSQTDFTARKSLEKSGVDPDSLKFVEIPPNNMLTALNAGQVDAIATGEPFFTQFKSEKLRQLTSLGAEAIPGYVNGTWNASDSYVKSNASVVEKFISAVEESNEYADKHPDEVRAIAAEFTKIDPGVLKTMGIPRFSGTVQKSDVESVAESLKAYGFISRTPATDSFLHTRS